MALPPEMESVGMAIMRQIKQERDVQVVGMAGIEKRLEDAKMQKARLLEYLRLWWTNLEDWVPDLETEMYPQPIQRVKKRKRKAGKSQGWKGAETNLQLVGYWKTY